MARIVAASALFAVEQINATTITALFIFKTGNFKSVISAHPFIMTAPFL
jgi:hypothetical protein